MAKKTKDSNLSIEKRLEQALIPNWDEPYKLPKNWCWTNLGSIAEIASGGTPSSSVSEYYDGGNIPWISPADLSNFCAVYIERGAKNITQLGLDKSSAKLLPKDTVCLSTRAPIGYVAIARNPLCTNQGFKNFLPSGAYMPKYLYWYLKGNKKLLDSYASGTTFLELSASKVAIVEIPLAPIEEQKRIVAHIESIFSKLDEAKEKAQEVVDGFETRKAAILHKAFSGELTEKWREENSVALTSWSRCAYSELGTSKLGKMLDKVKNSGRQVPYLRNVNVRWFGFDLSDVSQMLASEEEIKLLSVKRGDVFICEGGEPGRCAIWRESDSNMIFQKALHRFRPNDKIIGDFLCYNLYFLSVNGTLEKYFTGSTIKHLTGQSLAKIIVSVPTINEQKEIVDILDQMLSKEQQAKESAESVIEQIDAMKKSILARAFRGELGTNDPSEESAVELLKNVLLGNTNQQEPTKPDKKSPSIPNHIETALLTKLEKKIISLFYTTESKVVSVDEIMSVSSKKIDIIDTLTKLEQRGILIRLNNSCYRIKE